MQATDPTASRDWRHNHTPPPPPPPDNRGHNAVVGRTGGLPAGLRKLAAEDVVSRLDVQSPATPAVRQHGD